MSAAERDDWLGEGVKDARLRELFNRRYTPEKPPWLSTAGAVMFWATIVTLFRAGFRFTFDPTTESGVSEIKVAAVIAGIGLLGGALWLFLHLRAAWSYVSLEEGGVLMRSPWKTAFIGWNDLTSSYLVSETDEAESSPTYSVLLNANDGRRIRIGSYYDAQVIAADIDQVLAILRRADTGEASPQAAAGGDVGI